MDNDKYGILMRGSRHKVSELKMVANDTLRLILSESRANAEMVEIFVKIFFRTDIDFLRKRRSRKFDYVESRRLYMFLRYLYYDLPVQTVADEMGCTRANVYHHCESLFDHYDCSPYFREALECIIDEEIMKELKIKHDKKKW
jgi:hypothetical protein